MNWFSSFDPETLEEFVLQAGVITGTIANDVAWGNADQEFQALYPDTAWLTLLGAPDSFDPTQTFEEHPQPLRG